MKKLLSFIIATSLSASVANAATKEAKQLDYKEAAINDKVARTKEIGLAHAVYAASRDRLFYGPDGHLANVKNWFQDLNNWTNGWTTVITLLNSSTLNDGAKVKAVTQAIQDQMDKLHAIDAKRLDVIQKMADTHAAMALVKPFPTNYIAGAKDQIEALNKNFVRLQNDLTQAEASFQKESLDQQRKLCATLIELIKTKALVLALSFPELQKAVDQIQFSFDAFDSIDKFRIETSSEALAVRKLYVEDELWLQGLKRLQKLELSLEENVKKINAMTAFEQSFRDRVITSMQFSVNSVKKEIERSEADYPAVSKFKDRYDSEVYGFGSRKGLAERCKDNDRTLDCSLMRELIIYPATKLDAFNTEQLLYLEEQLENVKKGFKL